LWFFQALRLLGFKTMNIEQKLRDHLREVLEYCEQLGYELGLTGLEAKKALAAPAQEPVAKYADPFTYIVQCLNMNRYSMTKDECIEYIKELREKYYHPQPAPEFKGWYCAHCQRGVDASEVTFNEQHQVCGRVITDDVPPAQPAPDVRELERDAMRYRWLRNRDLESINQGGLFAGMTPDNVVLNGRDLDLEIDRAISEYTGAQ
jgi:hypothetical protein